MFFSHPAMKYSDIVDYDKLDPFKEEAIKRFRVSLANPKRLGVGIVPETIGETAVAVDLGIPHFYVAFNIEGLGTKNMIAEAMAEKQRIGKGIKLDRRVLFSGIGQDEMAMTLNDLAAIGATPILFEPIIATGSSDYLVDQDVANGLLDGFEMGAQMARVAIPGGETPTLVGIVGENTIDIAGASMGIISPKQRILTGRGIEEGLTIYGVESSGIHSNGVSLARRIAEKTKDGYFTALPTGRMLGKALLTPTTIYSPFLEKLAEERVDLKYVQPITGHGWAKIMRSKKDLKYVIENIPEVQEEFALMQEAGPVSDLEAYKTWNMGVGLVLFAPSRDSSAIKRAGERSGLQVYEMGSIQNGEREVVIVPKNISYKPKKQ